MDEREFFNLGERAGFTREQLSFMWAHIARKPHTHTSDEIVVDTADGETLEDYIAEMDSYDETEETTG